MDVIIVIHQTINFFCLKKYKLYIDDAIKRVNLIDLHFVDEKH